MITIIDYGMGNLRSVQKAFEYLGEDTVITSDPSNVMKSQQLVLPGVGAFPDGMDQLRRTGLDLAIQSAVKQGTSLLGICLGMQMLATKGFEKKETLGLNLIPGEIKFLQKAQDEGLKVPHVGWNDITIKKKKNPLANIHNKSDFYFVHSYAFRTTQEFLAASCTFGEEFAAAVERKNIFGTQFHPEKSQEIGLRVLANFAKWRPNHA